MWKKLQEVHKLNLSRYSRKVLWLRVGSTNNDPKVVAAYFLDYIKEVGGVPRLLRTYGETENVLIHDMQAALRADHNDDKAGQKSFIVGRSVSNQHIERYWKDETEPSVHHQTV